MFNNFIFLEKPAVCEKEWKNNVQPNGPHTTKRRMRISCWISTATNAHSEYVIHIAFPRQQWLRERASILRVRYTYIAGLLVP